MKYWILGSSFLLNSDILGTSEPQELVQGWTRGAQRVFWEVDFVSFKAELKNSEKLMVNKVLLLCSVIEGQARMLEPI